MITTNGISILLSCLLFANIAQAQTWVKGSAHSDQPGTYNNSLGPNNEIGARAETASWGVGSEQWFFGGIGYGNDSLSGAGLLNDLWKWKDMWYFVSGSTAPLVEQEIEPYNVSSPPPGARRNPLYWESDGLLWLLGGAGVDSFMEEGMLSDVWAYNISNGTWQFKSGSKHIDAPVVYNSTVDPVTNQTMLANPGSRSGAYSWLVEQYGKHTLWLYGGTFDEEVSYQDVWTYDLNNTWTWVAGPQAAHPPELSARATVQPSPRSGGASWVGPDGGLFLFGGFYEDPTFESIQLFNDVWKFNTTTLQWTLIQPATSSGVYDNSTAARPAPRYHACSTSDKSGNLYIFGGKTSTIEDCADVINDLWVYYASENRWKWVLGSNSTNAPGVYNETNRTGIPAARASCNLWIDESERLWLFGGSNHTEESFGFRNDLWILIDDINPAPPGTTTGNSSTITTGSGVPTSSPTTGGYTITSTTGPSPNATTGPYTITTGPSPSTTTGSNTITTGTQTLTSGSSTGRNTTGGSTLTSGGYTTSSGNASSNGNATTSGSHHSPGVSTGVIVGSVMGGGITISAGVVGFLLYRGDLRFRNLFRRNDADDDNELLPLNRRPEVNH